MHTIERSARELIELDTLPERVKQLHQHLQGIYNQIELSIVDVKTKYNMI